MFLILVHSPPGFSWVAVHGSEAWGFGASAEVYFRTLPEGSAFLTAEYNPTHKLLATSSSTHSLQVYELRR